MFRRRSPERIVDAGLVHCPVRGRDVDVERCGGCEALRAIEVDAAGRPVAVRCTGDAARLQQVAFRG
ncbi:hypothetical protein FTX61_02590 [Nitriliruptoraceae bacterium ZYF776]|nr:hypothetical protein [Profundirhabdus halotolerans]